MTYVTGVSRILRGLSRLTDRVPLRERRVFSAGMTGCAAAIAAHLLFVLFFYLLHVPFMFYYNFFSVLVFVVAMYLWIRHRAYVAVTSIALAEYILHQFLAVVHVGLATGFQYIVLAMVVVPFFVLPSTRIRVAVSFAAAAGLSFLALDLVFKNKTPIYAISTGAVVALNTFNVALSLSMLAIMAYLFVSYLKKAEDSADREYERAENLLHNILPLPIAERLKADPSAISDGFECATVLFTDIVDFTTMASRLTPGEVVSVLNDLFSRFDVVAERNGLEKIKTIGDAYMVASGIPERRDCHARYIAEFALGILDEIRSFNKATGYELRMRIGINSGPVVAGVIGRKKFIYDLWGDAVNIASRMESHGLPGKIQVSESTYNLLKDEYILEQRGVVDVKGKGPVVTYLLVGRKAGPV